MDITYNLGSTEYAWLNTYTQTLKFKNSGFHLTLQSATLTGDTTMSLPLGSGGLQDSAVSTAKIAANAVTPAKMAAANYKLSASCGAYTRGASLAFADVTNLVATLTCSGRPVRLELVPDGGASLADIIEIGSALGDHPLYDLRVKILRDSTEIFYARFAGSLGATGGSIAFVPSTINMIDVGAGSTTYVYKIQAADTAAGGYQFNNIKLLAFEIG